MYILNDISHRNSIIYFQGINWHSAQYTRSLRSISNMIQSLFYKCSLVSMQIYMFSYNNKLAYSQQVVYFLFFSFLLTRITMPFRAPTSPSGVCDTYTTYKNTNSVSAKRHYRPSDYHNISSPLIEK